MKPAIETIRAVFGLILLAATLFVGGLLTGTHFRPKCPPIIDTRIDTVFVRDTVRDTVRVPRTRYIVRMDTVKVQIAGDTVFIDAQIPIERKEYRTDDYRAVIEGFRPELIAMEVYRQTHYITKIETIEARDRRRWGIGIQAGYGATIRGGRVVGVPYIGVGMQYSILTW